MDWTSDPDPSLTEFVAGLVAFRQAQPALRRRAFFTGELIDPDEPLRDVHWLSPDGREMTGTQWGDDGLRVFGMQIGNDRTEADRLLILFNAGEGDVAFRLAPIVGGPWLPALDTTRPTGAPSPDTSAIPAGGTLSLEGRSIQVLTASGAFLPPVGEA